MADTPTPTEPVPPSEQMDRPHDPEERAAMDRDAGRLAMASEHHAFAGSADGVGSVEFDDPGAYDVGAGERPEAVRREPRAVGAESTDPGDSAARDRVRAGGLAPGEPEGGVGLAREAADHETEMREAQARARADGDAPVPAGLTRNPPD